MRPQIISRRPPWPSSINKNPSRQSASRKRTTLTGDDVHPPAAAAANDAGAAGGPRSPPPGQHRRHQAPPGAPPASVADPRDQFTTAEAGREKCKNMTAILFRSSPV